MYLQQIEQQLINIFNQLDEQDGIFTDEQLKELEITKENFNEKIKNYYYLLNSLKADVVQCKEEEDRIKEIRKSKENKIEKINKLLLDAVRMFGDTDEKGISRLDYGIFKLSTRKSSSANILEDRNIKLINIFRNKISELYVNNIENISLDGLLDSINAEAKAEFEETGENPALFLPYTKDDIACNKINVIKEIPLINLVSDDGVGYEYRRLLSTDYELAIKSLLDKTTIKNEIKDGYNITVGNVIENCSLQIK